MIVSIVRSTAGSKVVNPQETLRSIIPIGVGNSPPLDYLVCPGGPRIRFVECPIIRGSRPTTGAFWCPLGSLARGLIWQFP